MMVGHWFRVRAEDVFAKHPQACVEIASRHDIPVISLRKMRTRGGNYRRKRCVTLNLNLIQAPARCIEALMLLYFRCTSEGLTVGSGRNTNDQFTTQTININQ